MAVTNEFFGYLDRAYGLGETNWDNESSGSDIDAIIGKWFKRAGKRNGIFSGDQVRLRGYYIGSADQQSQDRSGQRVCHTCKSSLKRLQVDCIDLFYCRRVDGKMPIEKTVQAMA